MDAWLMRIRLIKITVQPSKKFLGILAAFAAALVTFRVLPNAWCGDLYWTGSALGATPVVDGSGTWVNLLLPEYLFNGALLKL
jgi:hypothetical protein